MKTGKEHAIHAGTKKKQYIPLLFRWLKKGTPCGHTQQPPDSNPEKQQNCNPSARTFLTHGSDLWI